MAGVLLVFIDPAYTSQRCAQCGHTGQGNCVAGLSSARSAGPCPTPTGMLPKHRHPRRERVGYRA
ncbi:zinc ribbon domain-containing protein [Streptomyces sp. NPDC005529]|uniref:zinc ribbon domain-containing protein n=1 Tax=unclassified Streptomyces TaxID=2593676 RepID=UPI0033BA8F06